MTDSVSPPLPAVFDLPLQVDKSRAFRAASRHSRAVRLLRLAMVAGVVGLVAWITVVTIFDPFRKLPAGVSIESAALDGNKITMAHPKLAGYQKDGRPYEISASSAIQDLKLANIFELHDLSARLTMTDRTITRIVAKTGIYDSADERMTLTSEVQIGSDSGLAVQARDARLEFKTGFMVTKNPVSVAMRGSTITADSMTIVDSGKQVTFEGHVRSLLLPTQTSLAQAQGAAGAAP